MKRFRSIGAAQKSGVSLLKTTTLVWFWPFKSFIMVLKLLMTFASQRFTGGLERVIRFAVQSRLMHD